MDREILKSVFKDSLNVTDYQADVIARTLEQYVTDAIINHRYSCCHWSPSFVNNSNKTKNGFNLYENIFGKEK